MDIDELRVFIEEGEKLRGTKMWTADMQDLLNHSKEQYGSALASKKIADGGLLGGPEKLSFNRPANDTVKDRFSFGAGLTGTGSARGGLRPEKGLLEAGMEENALDALASTHQDIRDTGGTTEGDGYRGPKGFRNPSLEDIWDEMPDEVKEEWNSKGRFKAGFYAFMDGFRPTTRDFALSKEKQAGRDSVLKRYPNTAKWVEGVGLAVGLIGGGYSGGKAAKFGVDVALEGPKSAARTSSKRLNDAADKMDYQQKLAEEAVEELDWLNLPDGAKELAGKQFKKNAEELRDFDKRFVDKNRRLGIKKNREAMKDELATRKLSNRRGGDLIRNALGDKADDIYKNALEGDATSRGKIINVWEQAVGEPVDFAVRQIMAKAPGKVYMAIAGVAGSSTVVAMYVYAKAKDNGYSSTEAINMAVDYVKNISAEDITKLTGNLGTIKDIFNDFVGTDETERTENSKEEGLLKN